MLSHQAVELITTKLEIELNIFSIHYGHALVVNAFLSFPFITDKWPEWKVKRSGRHLKLMHERGPYVWWSCWTCYLHHLVLLFRIEIRRKWLADWEASTAVIRNSLSCRTFANSACSTLLLFTGSWMKPTAWSSGLQKRFTRNFIILCHRLGRL